LALDKGEVSGSCEAAGSGKAAGSVKVAGSGEAVVSCEAVPSHEGGGVRSGTSCIWIKRLVSMIKESAAKKSSKFLSFFHIINCRL
jgi:hypothetical protein